MQLIHELEKIGYRFDLRLTFDYIKPNKMPPPEAALLFAELSAHKPEAVLYIAERKLYPQYIKASEIHRSALNKADTMPGALGHALAAIAAMTGDNAVYTQNVKKWLT